MRYRITQTRYYMSGKNVKSVVGTLKFHWRAWLYKVWWYDLAEPMFRVTVDWDIKPILPGEIRAWTVAVYSDSSMDYHRWYTVPAADGNDAMLMEFILDKGLPHTDYGEGGKLSPGVMELAKTHSRVTSVKDYE